MLIPDLFIIIYKWYATVRLLERQACKLPKQKFTYSSVSCYVFLFLAIFVMTTSGREQARAWSIYAWEFRRSLRRPCQEPQTRCKNMSRAEGITNHRAEQIGCACSMSSTQAPRTCPDRAKTWNWNAKIATSAWRPGQWTPSTYSITHRRNQ